ncbi:MAG: hypothetical protein HXY41_15995 [Chloroflexi bacterium]|nr:hypothetical protein [Chloroflexota bacterium]
MLKAAGLILLLMAAVSVNAQESAPDWPLWTKHDTPLYSGQFFVASDPVVLDEGDSYRMFYTCMDFLRESPRAVLCAATSPDGLAWTPAPVEGALEGLVLRGREGEWDENLEGAYAIRVGDRYLLYYSGYTDEGGYPAKGYPAALALAVSDDGIHFERIQPEPILSPTAGWYDNDAIYSEVVFEYGDGFGMIYVGHCYTRCDSGYGTTLLAAVSPDGYIWTKLPDPVLLAMPDDLPWTRDGVAEPAIVIEPEGRVTLFFTGLRDEDRWLGMARGSSPFGPWQVNPDPILKPTPGMFDAGGVLAPHVLIEGDRARMWYLGVQPVEGGEYFHVGYAEALWRNP